MKISFIFGLLGLGTSVVCAQTQTSFKFQFGPGQAVPGYTQVKADAVYSKDMGYGFEPGSKLQEMDRGGSDAVHAGFVTSGNIFKFSVAIPEGNYKVMVTLGDAKEESTTTVKAEARRLMLERIHTDAGKFETRSFYVSVRRPLLPDGSMIKLDVQEIDATGNLITPSWDDKLTLQFSDSRPCVDAIEIEKVENPITVFLMGDSTVTDQRTEPYGTWGQMLPRWFKMPVVIANYAESGSTVKGFRMEHRWDKVLSQLKPGDYIFMQFGHNDLNKSGHNAIWPANDPEGDWTQTYSEANSDYKEGLKTFAAEAKAHGAIPVIVSPMTKIDLRTGAINTAGLRDYPPAAVAAAKEAGVACIDLNAMSVAVWQALGPQLDVRGTVDGLHSDTYGGYLLSRCIVEGIRQNKLDLAKYLVDDVGTFDPAHPLPMPDDFKIPLEPRPAGRGGFGGRRGGGPAPAAPTPAAPSVPAAATTPSATGQ